MSTMQATLNASGVRAEKAAAHSKLALRKAKSAVLLGLVYAAAALTCALLIGLIGYIFVKGVPHITWQLLSTSPSALKDTIGILPNILNTLYIVAFSLLLALPLGVGAAVYLTEYATSRKLIGLVEFATEALAGIPSILYGLVGMLFFCQMLGFKTSLLSGGCTLVIMILPTIIRTTQESLKTVPASYREGALGLGATKWYMIRTILLPSAMPGILTGVILAIGRIVGESAALLFTAGSGYYLPKGGMGLFRKLFESGGTMTIELYLQMAKGKYDVAFGIACVLLALVLLLNLLTKYLAGRLNVENRK